MYQSNMLLLKMLYVVTYKMLYVKFVQLKKHTLTILEVRKHFPVLFKQKFSLSFVFSP